MGNGFVDFSELENVMSKRKPVTMSVSYGKSSASIGHRCDGVVNGISDDKASERDNSPISTTAEEVMKECEHLSVDNKGK